MGLPRGGIVRSVEDRMGAAAAAGGDDDSEAFWLNEAYGLADLMYTREIRFPVLWDTWT